MIKFIAYILFLTFIVNPIVYSQNRHDSAIVRTETINVISNRLETDYYSSPSSVFVLDKLTLNRTNGGKISDVLETVGGIFIKSYGGNSSLKSISINGMGTENVLILLNGMRLNSYQNSQFDLSLISKTDVESIEISYSGCSAAYGSDAVSGVLNIRTQNNSENNFRNNKLSARIKTELGSFNYKYFSGTFNGKFERLSAGFTLDSESSDEDFVYYESNSGFKVQKIRNNSDFDSRSLSANFAYKTNDYKFDFYSKYISNNRGIPGIISSNYSAADRQTDMNWYNVFSIERQFNVKNRLKILLSYQNNLMNYVSPGIENSYYKNIALNTNIAFSHKNNFLGYQAGVNIVNAFIQSNNLAEKAGRKQFGAYITSELIFGKYIKLFPSLRLDNYFQQHKTVLSGRLGLNLKPFHNQNFHIRSTIGNNYRIPTFNELYWIQGGNPDLKPEKSYNIDAGIIYTFNWFAENTIELKYSHIFSFDRILWRPVSQLIWSPVNISESRSNNAGISLWIKKKFGDFIAEIYADYTRNSSVKTIRDYDSDPSYLKQLLYVPIETSRINFNLGYKSLGFNFYYSFIGKRYTNADNSGFLPAIDLINANLYVTFNIHNLEIVPKLEINNLLNSEYQVISGYPTPLRNFKFGIQINY